METAILHYMDFIKIPENMARILVLDVSGLYVQIYDEFWCCENDIDTRTRKYPSPDFLCVRVE